MNRIFISKTHLPICFIMLFYFYHRIIWGIQIKIRHSFPIIHIHQDAREKKEEKGSEFQVLLIWQSSQRKKTNPDPLPQKTASRKLAEFCSWAPGCLAYKMTLPLPQPFYLIAPGAITVALCSAIFEKKSHNVTVDYVTYFPLIFTQ